MLYMWMIFSMSYKINDGNVRMAVTDEEVVLIIVMWMSGHPGNRRQWKAEMMTAATHLACVARSQSMGNGIPGRSKRS